MGLDISNKKLDCKLFSDQCGTSVAISLLDMHECGGKTKKHRNNGESLPFQDQPRSAFCFFM